MRQSPLNRQTSINVQATQTRPPQVDLRKSGNYTGNKQVVMRPLGPGGMRAPTASPGPSHSNNGNGNSYSNGNGHSNGSSHNQRNGNNGNIPVVVANEVLPPSYGSNGSNGKGIVIARGQVKDVMPSVRAMAAQAAVALPSMRPNQDTTTNPNSLAPNLLSHNTSQPPLVQTIDLTAESAIDRPSDEDFKWAQDSYSSTQRTIDTWTFFTVFRTWQWSLDQKWSYPGGFTEEKKKARTRALARYLLGSILNLGPTFIKIGQLSSTRSDLFPSEFTDELSKLQDRVPAFSAAKAQAIIEADLGRPITQLFKSFDPRPIAAASLGQVHRAVLFSGEEVVVKVQRPGLKQLFDIDLNNLRLLATQLDKGDEQNRDFKGIYQECATVLYQEIDYINEGKNADRFRRNFRDVPWVKVPIIHWEYCSPRVLTMQYLPGVKISSRDQLAAMGLDTDVVAKRATEAYLIQVLKHGFFHADPHPGNVSVDTRGNLLYYDFGMMGTIIPDIRERLMDLFYGIYKKDTSAVVTCLVQLGVIKPTGDMQSIRRAVTYFLENLAQQTERQETIAAIGEDLFAIAVDQPFRFPATFTFVLRAFSTLEGIGKTLNPNYKFSEVATPYAQELLALQDAASPQSMLVTQLQQQATQLGTAAAAMPMRVQRMDALLTSIESGDLKLRVRVLEAERAARRAGVMQAATMNVVGAMGFLNMGTMFALNNMQGPATFMFGAGAVFSVLVWRGFKRVERLDKFEKEIKG